MAGYREFQTGEVLTAGNVNSFLMEQATMTFADAAARDAALAGVLRAGLNAYLQDTDRLQYYDGTAWQNVPNEADVDAAGGLVATYHATADASQSIATTVMTDVTDLSITLTPASASSKFLILVSISGIAIRAANSGQNAALVRLMRDATEVFQTGTQVHTAGPTASGGSGAFSHLDEPATASEIVYKVQAASETTANSGSILIGGTNRQHSLSIFEVKA